jgi:MOSC domain-containing protein YiiM
MAEIVSIWIKRAHRQPNKRRENPACHLIEQMQKFQKPHGRAGIFGEIVEGGTIRAGDEVAFEGL